MRTSIRATVLLSMLACSGIAWSMPSSYPLTQCASKTSDVDLRECVAKQAQQDQKLFEASTSLAKSKLAGWVADDDRKKESSAAYDAALAAFKEFRRQQCEAYASTAGNADASAHDSLQKSCEGAMDATFAEQETTALANLPQRGSWLGHAGSLVDYAQPILDGDAFPDCATQANNKMHPDIVLMNCFEGKADDSAKTVKPAIITLLKTMQNWNQSADIKDLSSALYKVAKPAFDRFSVKQALFIGSLVVDDADKGRAMASMASQISWNSFYVDRLTDATKRVSK